MCGIAGLVDLNGNRDVPYHLLKNMADAIVHRGPDEEGYFRQPGVGLAMRRLSIVGLEDGQQPIFNEDQSVAVVYNGELFDHVERRAELEARGHVFKTHTDTEILPHLWEDHHEDMLVKLRGQFAFALFDKTRNEIILARDRFGIVPLYWTTHTRSGRDWFMFGSEVKALLASGLVDAQPDPRGIDSVFNFLAVPGPISCFKNIHILQPGKFLKIKLPRQGRPAEISEHTYWHMDFPDAGDEERGQDTTELADQLEAILYGAVKRRLRADVPVGAYLSGGIDSSTVVALAADVLGKAPTTFTSQIVDPKLDETGQATMIARHLGAKPHVVPCGPNDYIANHQNLHVATEAPVVDTSSTSLMMLANKVHNEGLKVVMTGEGSDEWLAGYPWFRMHKLIRGLGKATGGVAEYLIRQGATKWLEIDEDGQRHYFQCLESAGGINPIHEFYSLMNLGRIRFYSDGMKKRLEGHDPYAAMEPDLERIKRWHPLNKGVYWGARIHLPGHLLSIKGDRISMSQSVEMRYPFLDEEVFDFVAKIDPNWKMRRLHDKYIIRKVAERWLPKEVAWRPKGMFRAPLDDFFKPHDVPYVDQLLSEESLRKTGYFDPAKVAEWRKTYRSVSNVLYKRSSAEVGLIAVLSTQLWHHTFIDPTLADLPDWRENKGFAGNGVMPEKIPAE